jgi:hypothetical protein
LKSLVAKGAVVGEKPSDITEKTVYGKVSETGSHNYGIEDLRHKNKESDAC